MALVAAACGSGGAPAEVDAGRGSGAAIATVPAGIAELEHATLSGRNGSALAVAAGFAVVYGGSQLGNPSVYEPLADGAILDLATLKWRAMAPAPFREPLFLPKGISNGSEVLVVGTLCHNKQQVDDDGEQCFPGSIAAATYDPAGDAWRELEAPDLDPRPGTDGFAINPLFLGESGGAVAIDGDVWMLDLATGRWSLGPKPPKSNFGGCAIGDMYVALTTTVIGDASQADRAANPRLSKLGEGEWTELFVGDGAPESNSYWVVCLDDAVLLHSADFAYAKIIRFDGSSSREIAAAPEPLTLPSTLWTGDVLLVWDALGRFSYRYDPDLDRWEQASPGPAALRSVWAGSWALVQGQAVFDTDGGQVGFPYMTWNPT